MIQYFKVCIVGRPNVGKSSLFNRLLGKRVAIVDPVPGITRDRIFGKITRDGKTFELIDTGGFFEGANTKMEKALLQQLEFALNESDLILFMMDAIMGVHPMDKQILMKLKALNKKVIYVVNKVDNQKLSLNTAEFYRLGLKSFLTISVQHNAGIGDLVDAIVDEVPVREYPEIKGHKIAIVGKPNVGKSSFINKLLKDERLIVDSVPGTTRDSIAVDFTWKNEPFVIVDTAGLTRRKKIQEAVDSYSILRTRETLDQVELAVLITDADRLLESQDIRIGRMILDAGKACVILVNKWDLTKGVRQEHYKRVMLERFPFLGFAPIYFVSVKEGFPIEKMMNNLLEILKAKEEKLSTSKLNDLFSRATERTLAPFIGGKRLRIYYATQTSSLPPTFSLYINSLDCAAPHYLRYLENQIRKEYHFTGYPIKFKLVPKKKKIKK